MASILFFLIKAIDINFVSGPILILFGILIYFSIMIMIKGLRKEDLEIIKSIKPKFLKN